MTAGPREPHPSDEATDALPFDTLVGLRADDLRPTERRTLVLALGSARASAEHAHAQWLASAVSHLPAPPSTLHAGDVLERLAARRHHRALLRQIAAVALLGAACGLAALGWHLSMPAPQPPGSITFEAHAHIQGIQQPVSHGMSLAADNPLALSITASTGGALFITERFGYDTVRQIAPTSGRWEIEPGLHAITTALLPQKAPRTVLYEAWLCPKGARQWSPRTCSRDRLLIEWRQGTASASTD